ncbi:hypothetical protein DPMN_027517 [Dreissena polymorpha]|uniref:Uncharacterized protein n=1 Tax=Dreissena polymorpha TaxID=45954 RepID=A0A9D4RFB1_DREPO|nr:hypothetical protein DPMN_027517 [Dreissena polymorpha]
MLFSHERYARDGHGRRTASTCVIGPIVRALPGLHLTVSYRPGPSNYLKTTYSYPKAGHSRRAASTNVIGPRVCALWGAIDVSELSCCKLNLHIMLKRRKVTLSPISRSLSLFNHYGLTTMDELNSSFQNHLSIGLTVSGFPLFLRCTQQSTTVDVRRGVHTDNLLPRTNSKLPTVQPL